MNKKHIIIGLLSSSLCTLTVWYVLGKPDYESRALSAPPTTIRFEEDSLHLGNIKYGTSREVIYRFTNTGTNPLMIRDIRPSCGCTSVKWEKRPLNPGESGEIRVHFDPNSLGRFSKNIEVLCNIQDHRVILILNGSVVE